MEKINSHNTAQYTDAIPHTPLRFLWWISKRYRLLASVTIAIVIFVATLDTLAVLLIQAVIAAAEANDAERVIVLGILYPVALFGIQMTWRITGLLGRLWAIGIQKITTDTLFTYSLNHSHRYFADRFAGSLMSKIGNVTGAMERLVVDLLWHHLERFVALIVGTILLWQIDITTGMLFAGLILVIIVVNYYLVPRKRIYSLALANSRTRLRGRIVDVYSNVTATRQYAQKADELSGLQEYSQDTRDRQSISWLFSEYMLVVNSVILSAFSVLIFIFLVDEWIAGTVSTSAFVTVMMLIFNLSGALIFIGRAFNDTAAAYGEAEEGLSEILLAHEIVDAPEAAPLKNSDGNISWNNVTFEYGDNKVFDDFNLHIHSGERIGLVGPSGAGKTTFVSLLLRQHDLTQGSIMIDGQNIAEVTQDSLREAIAVVPQEPMLFHRSIRENIAYGKPGATQEEIEAVAKKAQAHDFIRSLPEGYHTLVGERGIKLSGGQKQRVAIARAMLKDAPILVLDEATSALDSESEVAIQKALHVLMNGKTVIAIAHRLSTLREMDRILVLEAGKIVEDGPHEKLAKAGGTYQRLWEHQAGGFLLE